MYTLNECPVVEIVANSNSVYFNNIKKIISIKEIKRILVHNRALQDEQFIHFVIELAKIFKDKFFYVNKIDSKLCIENVGLFHIFDFASQEIIEYDKSTLMILRIDVNQMLFDTVFDKHRINIKKINIPVMMEFYASAIPSMIQYKNILKMIFSLNKNIYLSSLVKVRHIIKDHPCNAYLCNGNKCHSGKTLYPRYMYIDINGIDPYKSGIDDLKFFKNINTEEIDDFSSYMKVNYFLSYQHNLFIDINKLIYRHYVLCGNIVYLPWNILMKKVYYEFITRIN